MSWSSSRLLALLAALASLSFTGSGQAAPCGRPDVDLTFPADGASDVPTNALLSAHYGSPALYDDEPVSLRDAANNEVTVTVAYDEADSMLRATPAQALAKGDFVIVWPGLRGVSSSGGLGRGSSVAFSVGSASDEAAPVFAGLSAIEWDLSRDRDPCLDRLDDRFVFRLGVGQASDDSGRALLSLLLFETRQPSTPEQSEPSRVAVRAWPEDGQVEVRRPAKRAGETCFAAIATDLFGRVSGGGEREVCVKTQKPPFFDGCAITTVGSPRPGALALGWFTLLGLALLRRGKAAHARMPAAV